MEQIEFNNNNILIDRNKETKKINNWKKKKEDSILLSESYERINDYLKINLTSKDNFISCNKIERVKDCASYLDFKLFSDENMKLHRANFCKDKFCPMCSWRRTKKIFAQVSNVMNEIELETDYRFIFLTLTQRNVYGENLREEIDKMMKAFSKLRRRSKFMKNIKGYFRALEVTYNKNADTYHPHFHCVLVVEKDYFKIKEKYFTHKDWIKLWRESMRLGYDPNVDVRVVKKKKEKKNDEEIETYSKAVSEISKYSVKSSDIFQYDDGELDLESTDSIIYNLYLALYQRRLIGMGGIVKEIHKKLNLDDVESENANLIITEEDDKLRDDLNYIIVHYVWNVGVGNYILDSIIDKEEDEEILENMKNRYK